MPDTTAQSKATISDEPPLGFAPADIIATARRVRRRRRSFYGAVTVSAAAAVATGAALTLPTVAPAGHAPALSLTALARTAATRPASASAVPVGSASIDGVSAAQVITLAQEDTGTKLASVQVSILRPPGELDLAAALTVPGRPSLNIQITKPHTMSTATTTCAALSDLSSGTGDGYHGPCAIQRLGDGSILIERSGHTASGGFTMAQATLIRADGSGVFAEDTNQAALTSGRHITKKKTRTGVKLAVIPPVVRTQPALDASTLAILVRDIAAQTQTRP
jgi:hypothetical protein